MVSGISHKKEGKVAKRILASILAILAVGAFPAPSEAQVGCGQEAVVINPPTSSTFDGRFNVNPTAPAGFMAVLFVGMDMPGEPQKAILLRPVGGWLTYSSGVFYAVCSGDLRGVAVRYGWDLYARGYGFSPVEAWDSIVSPPLRLARWEAYTPVPAPVPVIPVPVPPYVPVPQPVPSPVFPIPYPQPAPMPIALQPLQPCGPLNYTTVSPDLGRVYGAAVIRVKFRDYALKVVRSIAGDQTAFIREAEAIEVVEAPGCGLEVVGTVANSLVTQGGSVSYDSAPPEFQGKISVVRR